MFSEAVYLQIEPASIAMFRFLLEAHGHLGYMTVVDKHAGIIKVVHTADCAKRVHHVLKDMQDTVAFSYCPQFDI